MGYTKSFVKGMSWLSGIRFVTRLLSFGKTIIIARILSPEDVGIFGIAILLLTLIEVFTETGVNIFLVQQKENIDEYIDTAWLVSIFRGIIITLFIVISAPFVASFFHSPQAFSVILMVSIVSFVRGFINPAIIKFQKELTFQKQFLNDTSIALVEVIISVTLILITHSVMSLIWGMIGSVLFECLLSFIIVKPRPHLIFHKQLFFQILNVGKWITLSTIFNFLYQHGDDIIVGRLLNTVSLGIYDMAYRLSLAPMTDISDATTAVAFPVYVKISGDKERLKRAYLKSLGFVLLFIIPVNLVIGIFPAEVITLILGTKWLAAAPVLQVLALVGVLRTISIYSSTLFLSVQKQKVVSMISIIGFMGLALTIIPFVMWWGIIGASLSALIGTLATLPIIIYYLSKQF